MDHIRPPENAADDAQPIRPWTFPTPHMRDKDMQTTVIRAAAWPPCPAAQLIARSFRH